MQRYRINLLNRKIKDYKFYLKFCFKYLNNFIDLRLKLSTMKNLAVLLVVLLFCSCEKDEPKSLIVINAIDQSLYTKYSPPNFTESVMLLYSGSDHKYVRIEKFPVYYTSVQNIGSYEVTSATLQDEIVSVSILVQFYYSINGSPFVEYQSELIPIHEGVNTYTITEKDLVK